MSVDVKVRLSNTEQTAALILVGKLDFKAKWIRSGKCFLPSLRGLVRRDRRGNSDIKEQLKVTIRRINEEIQERTQQTENQTKVWKQQKNSALHRWYSVTAIRDDGREAGTTSEFIGKAITTKSTNLMMMMMIKWRHREESFSRSWEFLTE
jgi:hypothetical protein